MEQIFNIIPGPDEGSCCILLYGVIGPYEEVTASDIVSQILEAEKTYRHIDVRINSVGGDVFAGIAIFNALRQATAEVTIYIDCIAASTASFIAACGRTVKMSRYAQIMLHRPSCWVDGDAKRMKECAEELEKVENILCRIYSERTGKDVEDIRTTYMDGAEHWLSATEAKALGFVDEIYDSTYEEPISNAYTPQQRCERYTARYLNHIHSHNTKKQMFEKLKKMPAFSDCADEEAVFARISAMAAKAKDYDNLAKKNTELVNEVNGYKKKEQEAHDKAIADELEQAVLAGKIGENNRAHFEAMLHSDYENAHAILESLPAKKRIPQFTNHTDPAPKTAQDMVEEEARKVNERQGKVN